SRHSALQRRSSLFDHLFCGPSLGALDLRDCVRILAASTTWIVTGNGLPFRRSRIGAWTRRYRIVPAGQMSKLRSYLYVCQRAADIDCDERSNIGDREAVAGNKLMPV